MANREQFPCMECGVEGLEAPQWYKGAKRKWDQKYGMCYQLKWQALVAFATHNSDAVEALGGLSLKHSEASFDATNHVLELTGTKAACVTAGDAIWESLQPVPGTRRTASAGQGRRPAWCIADIDIETLNDNPLVKSETGGFRIPDYVAEHTLTTEEQAYWAEEEAQRAAAHEACKANCTATCQESCMKDQEQPFNVFGLEGLDGVVKFERKSPDTSVAFVTRVGHTGSGRGIKVFSAARATHEGGGWRIDFCDAVSGAWLPWEPINDKTYATLGTAQAAIREWARTDISLDGLEGREGGEREPRYSEKRGWTGGDPRTLYAITDKRTGKVQVRPGGGSSRGVWSSFKGVGPEVTIRVATRSEAMGNVFPRGVGWMVADGELDGLNDLGLAERDHVASAESELKVARTILAMIDSAVRDGMMGNPVSCKTLHEMIDRATERVQKAYDHLFGSIRGARHKHADVAAEYEQARVAVSKWHDYFIAHCVKS
jgi:hypothetical protein